MDNRAFPTPCKNPGGGYSNKYIYTLDLVLVGDKYVNLYLLEPDQELAGRGPKLPHPPQVLIIWKRRNSLYLYNGWWTVRGDL